SSVPRSVVGCSSFCFSGGGLTGSFHAFPTRRSSDLTVVSATSDIPLAGDGSVTRTTDGSSTPSGLVNSGPASKTWADAKIAITPATATNAVNTNHTLTITVTSVGANLGNGTATASITSGPGHFVGSPHCSYTGGGLTASCNVVITSTATGTTVVSATSDIPLAGDGSVTRTTDGSSTLSGLVNSGPASKTWADAKIAITPATGHNAV